MIFFFFFKESPRNETVLSYEYNICLWLNTRIFCSEIFRPLFNCLKIGFYLRCPVLVRHMGLVDATKTYELLVPL